MIKKIFNGLFGGLVPSNPSKNVVITNVGSGAIVSGTQSQIGSLQQSMFSSQQSFGMTQQIQNAQQNILSAQQAMSLPSIVIPAGTNINATATYGGVITYPNGSVASFPNPWQQIKDAHEKKVAEQKETLSLFNNDVKIIYADIKDYITSGYTGFNLMPNDLAKDIKVCEILERHLKVNKFNNKLEDLINE